MKNMIKIAAVVCAASASLPSLAAGAPGSGPNPYSDCGIGAAIFRDTDWAAATSNVTWDLGSTAVTSATASPETCSKKNVKAAMLIRDAYAQIMEDAARGQGDHLSAVLEVFECGAVQRSQAISTVRRDVAISITQQEFQSQEPLERAGQLYGIIDSAARQHCAS